MNICDRCKREIKGLPCIVQNYEVCKDCHQSARQLIEAFIKDGIKTNGWSLWKKKEESKILKI